jgi:putative tryptophan/tyrosine transport system substrate-binding protein
MRRREFISGLGSAAAAWPLTARAQQALPVIGFLGLGSSGAYAPRVAAFRQGLNGAGYVEGRNVSIEYRWPDGQFDRIPALAADLVRRQVTAIFADGPPAVLAIKAQTTVIPIVFVMGEDPVKEGLVASFSRPGGNVTGFSNFQNQLGAKKLQLLSDAVPNALVLALLVNPTNPNAEADAKDVQMAAAALGRELRVFGASTENDFERAFAAMAQSQVGALLVNIDPFFLGRREQIVALAGRYAVPAIYDRREFPFAGGLMSYGGSELEAFRQGGAYVGRVLKGEKPADLPVQQSTRFEFVINLKTAKTLGLTVPETLLVTADEVID